MRKSPLSPLVFALIGSATVLVMAQGSPDFKPLPKLQSSVPMASAPPRVASLSRPTETKFAPLPRLEPGDPQVERSATAVAIMRTADQSLWQAMTNAVFQAQFQQTMTLLKIANQQPGVRAKVEAARKEVQDYIRQHSPEMMPVFEKMNAPRELQRQEGQLTELVF
ncbi:MAG: hypothetical protein ABS95_01810 [Verrucomicrobia bacterium SCN 57-15]|nr:MAG: hypothetical protein ABS95_01810 [Verrucomicrobia bacterium SCN 57-15]